MNSAFDREFWGVDCGEWNDWRWQLRESWRTPTAVMTALSLPADSDVCHRYPMQATPFYLSLAQRLDVTNPILRQCVAIEEELTCGGGADPFHEEAYSPVPRLVHRYPDRVLFMTTSRCATHCRHCMRKRNWQKFEGAPSEDILNAAVDYIAKHREIREILISGGDPLTLEDGELAHILGAFATVEHLEMFRIGSRVPVVMPQRLTESLCNVLENCGKTVWIASHFNHPLELSEEARQGVERLLRHGVPVVNQSVLLKGVNDDAETLRILFTGLLKMKVKPYYLFHGDPIEGTMHFRTGVQRGLELMAALRNRVSGMAMPAFSFDLPDGGGKIRLEPDAELEKVDGGLAFTSFEGRKIVYK
ncbi:MAG: KamA family radical SAM protein [Victivallales bacterium]|nr:KamA family radical SAM protein [Victivallales bacterium]